MPDPSVLSDRGRAMLAMLPPQLRGSYDYLAVVNALSKEVDRLEAAIEQVRAQFNPATADVMLNAWEYQLKLPVGGAPGATIDTRRQAVIARLRKVMSGGQGREWEQAVTNIVGPGWSYLEAEDAGEVNLVPDPSFEHDTTGAAPAAWADHLNFTNTGATLRVVASAAAPFGAKCLQVTTAGIDGQGAEVPIAGTFRAGVPVSFAMFLWGAGQQWVLGLGNDVDSNETAIITLSGVPVRYSVSWTPTLDRTGVSAALIEAGHTADALNADGAIVAVGTPAANYGDGDSPGWGWAGAPGNSVSQQGTLAPGVVQITVPFPSGSSKFIEAQNQIRDITDAHLELEFVSTATFQLDVSELDVQEFGG